MEPWSIKGSWMWGCCEIINISYNCEKYNVFLSRSSSIGLAENDQDQLLNQSEGSTSDLDQSEVKLDESQQDLLPGLSLDKNNISNFKVSFSAISNLWNNLQLLILEQRENKANYSNSSFA